MKNIILASLILAAVLSGAYWLGSRDSCSNPDFASYGSVSTCK
jgi:hypothetical protein